MADENIMNEELEELEEAIDDTLVLTDDEGVEVEFEYVDSIDYEGNEYVVLLPVEEEEDGSAEVLILKVEELESQDGEEPLEQYVSLDDEELLDTLFALFKEANEEYFDFVED